jgi:LysM repeat protein
LRRLVDGIVALSITSTVVANDVPSPAAGATTHVAPNADRDVGFLARLPATAGMKMAVYRSTSPLPDPVPGSTTHTVEPGDSLWDIAERTLGDARRWPEIWNANRDRLAAAGYEDPSVLLVGWVLEIPNPSVAPRPSAHTVRPGETLSQIAGDQLGNPGHADQLFALNVGRPQPGGDSLADPDLIRPGWSLVLPSEPNGHTAPPGEPQPTEVGEPSDSDEPPVTAPAPADDPPPTIDGQSGADDSERGTGGTAPGGPERSAEPSTTVPGSATPPDTGTGPPTTVERDTDDDEDDEHVPIPVLGAAGTLLAVATLRAVRRRWARRAATSPVASVPDAPPPSARPALREMLEADGSYARGVDAALAHLAAALRPRSGEGCPQPRLVQVRPERIDVLLDRPDSSPPPPWRPEASGLTWVLDGAAVVDAMHADVVTLPALVTVGVGEGDLLIDLEAYGVVSVVGDESGCRDVARSMVAELSARSEGTVLIEVVGDALAGTPVGLDGVSSVPSWDEVDTGAIDASARMLDTGRWPHTFAARVSGRIYDGWAPTVWVTESSDDDGYEDALERVAARPGAGSAIVVVGADPGRGLRIEVDAEGGFVIPELGLSGEVQRLGADIADQLVELVEDADAIPDAAIDDQLRDSPGEAPPGDGESHDHGGGIAHLVRGHMGYEDPPFDVLVRVCGPLRVEGGRHELAQRETAVACFVALNGQADVDQIREAVWAGAPVTRKRIQNVVSTVRGSVRDAVVWTEDHRLAAGPGLLTDLELVRRRLAYARHQHDPAQKVEILGGGLAHVTGRVCSYPESRRRCWSWITLDNWIAHVESVVATFTTELARTCLEVGDGAGTCEAATRGIEAAGKRDELVVLLARGYELTGDELSARSVVRNYERYLDELGVDALDDELLDLLDRYAAPARHKAP